MRADDFAAAIGDWSLPVPDRRFRIYRNNVASALINALRVRYPVVEQLVGQDFFAGMAGEFSTRHRPDSPVLISYGAGLPEFIRGFPPAAGVPYLADVADLENLWWRAYHAADIAPARADLFATVAADQWGDVRFQFHPSVGLLSWRHAIGAIWLAHRGGPAMGQIRTDRPEHVLVARPGSEVFVRVLPVAGWHLIKMLHSGRTLAEAVEQVSECHPGFDLAAELQGLITLNIITGLTI
jgi:hypothetical protein